MTTPRIDIAVIGIACRFPGADSPDGFWTLLRGGTDAVTGRPPGRVGGRPAGRGGYLRAPAGDVEGGPVEESLAAIYGFEPEFFGMSPREARRTDPQQRLTLELGWEALEDAGIVPGTLRGTRTGVFLAAANGEWADALRAAGVEADVHTYTGAQRGMAAGRLSHVLGLSGPSLSVDTGQSSSLAAVHLAVESLRAGTAEIALAGGVSLMLDDAADRAVAGTGALSAAGRSAVFDASADGFVRGEGGALVVLKPLAAALADGDRMYCVLRGSALNHDGGGGTLTMPQASAQADVLAQAYDDAGLAPETVGYVELHGTGTRAGDPVEAAALGALMDPSRRSAPLRVGSVKTVIGHLEGAAGIAGLVKTALAVHHAVLPPSLHFATAHPAIPLERLALRVQTALERWEGPRIAGVSSFGMGGANCHVVVEAPPAAAGPPASSIDGSGTVLWPVSARSPKALRAQLAALRAHIADLDGGPHGPEGTNALTDVTHTLALGRTHFAHRCAVVASSREQLLDALTALANRDDASGTVLTASGADAAGTLTDVARRHVQGLAVDWVSIGAGGRRVGLPTYHFTRRLLLPEATTDGVGAPPATAAANSAHPHHPSAAERPHDGAGTAAPDPGRDPDGGHGGGTGAEHNAGDADPFEQMLALVLRETGAVLELDPDREVPADAAFASLGADSMTMVELTDRLEDAVARPLPSSLLFDRPTPREVARALVRPTDVSAPLPRSATVPVAERKEPDDGRDAIALVGIGCRFPGGINSAEDLWAAVAGERDVLGDLPDDRGWAVPEGRWRGGFLDDAAGFDAAFFGISPREATAMDPQQRLLLEVGWEAVEHAGIDPLSLRATQTGVFVGVIAQQYDALVQQSPEDLDGYVYTGSTPSVLAGRLAYVLGLEGPALAVDTACSSSLTALHLACRALRSGEVSMALAGGVTVMSTPWMFTDFTAQGALSPDGRSKAFAEGADGTGWSEGVGMVVLERLSDARRNGHQVLAVVRGSALNEDGASNGLTAPNGSAQVRMIRAALADAGLPPAHVDAVEAHGPGTRLGDPIEANALLATYGAERAAGMPLWLGSVKSNIGHTQAAAGVAGVIKTVMAMRHRLLPRTLHVDRPTSRVDWSGGGVRVLTEARPWPSTGRPPRAAVSGFGAGGTNAHIVLEAADEPGEAGEAREAREARDVRGAREAGEVSRAGEVGEASHVSRARAAGEPRPSPAGSPSRPEVGRPLALPLSGKSAAALAGQAARLHTRLLTEPAAPLPGVARTLARRSAFAHRAVAVAHDRAGLLAALADIARGEGAESQVADDAAVFVFPGQGAQWPDMAEGLLGDDPVFTETARQCAEAFSAHLDWSVLDVLAGAPDAPPLDRVDVVQPALFTMMVSLARMWQSRGVRPAAVVGHSQGEIAAAHVAGALSLADAARIVALRSRALLGFQGRGAMAAVFLPADALSRRLEPWAAGLEIAAVNGPAATTVGGEPAALDSLLAALDAEGVPYRRLPVSNAGHSRQIEPLREHLLDVLAPVAPRASRIPFYSTVTGERLDTTGLDADYWWRNARQPVLLEPAVRALLATGHRAFVEVNPHPLLHSALLETFEDAGAPAVALSTLRRDEPSRDRFLEATAEAFRAGLPVDWTAQAGPDTPPVPLPGYAFQHRRFWPAPPVAATPPPAPSRAFGHPFVTAPLDLPHTGGHLVTARVSAAQAPWLTDHALFEVALVPGAALVELVSNAARHAGAGPLDEFVVSAPLLLPADGGALELQVVLDRADPDGTRAVSLYARARDRAGEDATEPGWTVHAHGRVTAEPASPSEPTSASASAYPTHPVPASPTHPVPVSPTHPVPASPTHPVPVSPTHPVPVSPTARPALGDGTWPPQGAQEMDIEDAYDRLAAEGYTYGPALRALRGVWRRSDGVFAEVALPAQAGPADGFDAHPVLIDAALHALLLAELAKDGEDNNDDTRPARMPFAFSGVRIRPSTASSLRIHAEPGADGSWRIAAVDPAGAAVFDLDAVSFLPATGIHPPLRATSWTPAILSGAPATSTDTTIVGPPHPALPGVPAADTLPAAGAPVPRIVVVHLDPAAHGGTAAPHGLPDALHTTTARHLELVRAFLGESAYAGTRLVLSTRRATARRPDPVAAAVAALWRSAAAEHPGQLTHVDSDGTPASDALLALAVAADLPQVALRDGQAHVPVLAPVQDGPLSPPPGPGAWKLALTGPARQTTPDRLALVPAPEYDRAPGSGEVRVAVRAAGLNFVDVITTMGLFPGEASLGREFAGVVTEVGPDTPGLAPGDRVMGIVALDRSAITPRVVTDHRLVAPVPDGWTFAEAATVPIAFLTAHHGLVTLGRLTAGERVLIHAASGGVGMAALQIARRLGAEVFATAHPDKWPTLAALGVPSDRTASSRTAGFEEEFRTATGGRGMDVVLNALAGPLVDASLRLLAPGGRFLEMGKLDIRTRTQVDAVRPDAHYQPFDVLSVDPDDIATALRDLGELFLAGELHPLPLTAWDVREAKDAMVTFRDARHVGKLVLTLPSSLRPDGTVLITGGAGTLGGELARHLVRRHRVRRLLLSGRAPADEPRVAALLDGLNALGAHAEYRQADVSDPVQVAELLAAVPSAHPLTAVVHTSGILRDATVMSLGPEQLSAVLSPKADGAWHLHEQTRHLDLARFTLYSSVAGVLGLPGQANYAAANGFLDALACVRASDGLPAQSLAWGLWEQRSAMSGHLTDTDIARMAAAGLVPLPTSQGLALFDAAADRPEATLVAARGTASPAPAPALAPASPPPPPLPSASASASASASYDAHSADALPALTGTFPARTFDTTASGTPDPDRTAGLPERLSALPAERRLEATTDWITGQAVTVLRLTDPDDVRRTRAFRDLGFDSLTSVELRNRLNAATGLRLPVTVVFDHPTLDALADRVVELLFPAPPDGPPAADAAEPASAADDTGPAAAADDAGSTPAAATTVTSVEPHELPADLAQADGEELLQLIDAELGRSGGTTHHRTDDTARPKTDDTAHRRTGDEPEETR
ncbi:SDR family NAD(P)-dependent oxidoreductase [Streptomyces sp. NPDC088387]|uniref:SDR family NAD(P)-dependent oxidoreductase n=1 Tax=Streptomyces sp. NPDC088387 TaxID=3365859 RepID=UPI0038244D87